MVRWAVGDDVHASTNEATRAWRQLFLVMLGDEAPAVVAELWALPSDEDIPTWAADHGLDKPWVKEEAAKAREFWRTFRTGRGADQPPTAWPVDDDNKPAGWTRNAWLPDPPCVGLNVNEIRTRLPQTDPRHPEKMTSADALRSLDYFPPLRRSTEKDTTYEKRRRAYDAARRRAFAEYGAPLEHARRRKVEPDYLRWLVRYVVHRESYRTIARRLLNPRPLRYDDRLDARWRDVKRAVRPLGVKLGLL